MKNYTNPGLNRTGLATAPMLAKEMLEVPDLTMPSKADRTLLDVRLEYAKVSPPMSVMPPPGSLKELAKTAGKMIKGEKATVLVDKLGERLAFERTGVRLYEGVLLKHDAFGSWRGGPSREMLEEIRDDELSHFQMLTEAIAYLGSDPTAMTPSANLHANISEGIPKVIADPRTDLRQSLEAAQVAELADNACWETLIDLARAMDHEDMAELFEVALSSEQRHLRRVRAWLSAAISEDAMGRDVMPKRGMPMAGTGRGSGDGKAVTRKRPGASAKTSRRRNGRSKRT